MAVTITEGGGVDLSSLVPDLGLNKQVCWPELDLRIFRISCPNSFMDYLPYMVRKYEVYCMSRWTMA